MGPESSLVISFRVCVPIASINIGPLLINRKDYHKNGAYSGNYFKFQQEFLFNFFDYMHMKNIFVTSQSRSWPELVWPYLKLWLISWITVEKRWVSLIKLVVTSSNFNCIWRWIEDNKFEQNLTNFSLEVWLWPIFCVCFIVDPSPQAVNNIDQLAWFLSDPATSVKSKLHFQYRQHCLPLLLFLPRWLSRALILWKCTKFCCPSQRWTWGTRWRKIYVN